VAFHATAGGAVAREGSGDHSGDVVKKIIPEDPWN